MWSHILTGHGDLCGNKLRAGCVELLHTVQKRVRPKYHVFGHIHEGKKICELRIVVVLHKTSQVDTCLQLN